MMMMVHNTKVLYTMLFILVMYLYCHDEQIRDSYAFAFEATAKVITWKLLQKKYSSKKRN